MHLVASLGNFHKGQSLCAPFLGPHCFLKRLISLSSTNQIHIESLNIKCTMLQLQISKFDNCLSINQIQFIVCNNDTIYFILCSYKHVLKNFGVALPSSSQNSDKVVRAELPV